MKPEWLELLQKVTEIAKAETGLLLNEKNYSMMESRLIKRIYQLNLTKPEEYLSYLNANTKLETPYIVTLITTHHTAFFREYFHFEDIENKFISEIINEKSKQGDKTIRIWSSACSHGQEVYSLSMFFYKLQKLNLLKGCDYKILGSDVDEDCVKYAKNGVFLYKDLIQSPVAYIHGNWSRGMGEIKDFVKPKPHIRTPLSFETRNLLNLDQGTHLNSEKFDIIFCRNVLIYFNPEQIQNIIQGLLKKLSPHGILVLGISESLQGLKLPVKLILNNIYRHDSFKPQITSNSQDALISTTTPQINSKKIRLICVDDSPTILAILKKILTPEKGFEIVATAKSAAEAREKLKTTKADIMILDIHMEGENGIDYLKKDFHKNTHPPVIMLSSVGREDSQLSQQAIAYGASDYVEKPDLKNITVASDELCFKVKTIFKQNEKSIEPKNLNFSSSKIKVLIVDDSPTIHVQIKKMLSKNTQIEIIGSLTDPRKLEQFIIDNKPDVITLDINMPHINGVEIVQKIMPNYPIPCIMISSIGISEGTSVMEALDYGAFDYFQKPSLEFMEEESHNLIDKVVAAKNSHIRIHKTMQKSSLQNSINQKTVDKEYLIAIGSSTGGTEAIKCILETLPENIPPIVIVQHIPEVFSKAFADRLNTLFPFKVIEAQDNQIIEANCVYIAPGNKQMKIIHSGKSLAIHISNENRRNNHRPSVDVLFDSIHELKLKKVVGIILTGMGSDGAVGLKKLKDIGAKTIAQNKETCVVFGMPNEAIKLGAVLYEEPIEKIGEKIISLVAK